MRFVFLAVCLNLAFSKLLMVIEFARHGAREPIYDFLNSTPFDSKGELTPVGMKQHYLLGTSIRKLYVEQEKLLSEQYDQKEIYVQSTNYNRTILSAISHLYGLYPLETGPKIDSDLEKKYLNPPFVSNYSESIFEAIHDKLGDIALSKGYQPIPVHVIPLNKDILIRPFDLAVCPGSLNLLNAQYSTKVYKDLNDMFKANTFKNISSILGMKEDDVNLWAAFDFYDIYENFQFANLTFPVKLSEELLKNLTFIHDITIYFIYFGSEKQKRLFNTPIFNEILRYFDRKIKGKEQKKFVYYSGHDRTLSMILSGLNYSNFECAYEEYMGFKTPDPNNTRTCLKFPHYAANLLIELHQNEANLSFVKIRYNGMYLPMCGTNKTSCDYDVFSSKIRNFVVEDFVKECRKETDLRNNTIENEGVVSSEERESVTKVFAFLFGLILGCTIVSFIYYYKYIKRERDEERDSEYFGI